MTIIINVRIQKVREEETKVIYYCEMTETSMTTLMTTPVTDAIMYEYLCNKIKKCKRLDKIVLMTTKNY